jgi:hypothetical protein
MLKQEQDLHVGGQNSTTNSRSILTKKKKRREYKNLDDWLNAIVRGYNEMKIIKIYI